MNESLKLPSLNAKNSPPKAFLSRSEPYPEQTTLDLDWQRNSRHSLSWAFDRSFVGEVS